MIQKISDEWSGSVSSDKESYLENHEQENEAQVVDNIDDINQELCVQPTDRMPDDVSLYESASGSLSNSTNALSTPTNQNVHEAGGKAQASLQGRTYKSELGGGLKGEGVGRGVPPPYRGSGA